MSTDSIGRFSRTVENYLKYRPTYPPALVEFLQAGGQLPGAATIADIASGTGRLTEVFLRAGYPVFGVEPNPEMRAASQHYLQAYPRFVSVAATAEETTLANQSVDLITAGQAFHWFDREKSRREFARFLKPQGWVALVWNIPRNDTPFLAAYEQFWLKHLNPDAHSAGSDTQAFDADLRAWYAPGPLHFQSFDNPQVVDWEGLQGRVLSSSFSPTPDQPGYPAMLAELETLFQTHQLNGQVTIGHECRMSYGQLL